MRYKDEKEASIGKTAMCELGEMSEMNGQRNAAHLLDMSNENRFASKAIKWSMPIVEGHGEKNINVFYNETTATNI